MEIRDDLKGIYHHLTATFDYYYVDSKLSHANDSIFDKIIEAVEYALDNTPWSHKNEGEILMYKICTLLDKWKQDRDDLRSRGAGLNYEAIPRMKREVLEILEKA